MNPPSSAPPVDSSKPAPAPRKQKSKPSGAGYSLGAATIVNYSLPSFVTSVAALPMALLIPAYYSDNLGIPLATVGIAIAASRLLDVVTDPLIGTWSDRLSLPLGRRKTWMLVGAPIFLFSLWKVFVPGDDASGTYLALWSAALYLGFTMIDLPHKAWGAELSTDYDERTRITSWREAISVAGQVLLLAALVLLAAQGVVDAQSQLRQIAVAVCLILPILLVICLLFVSEVPKPQYEKKTHGTFEGLSIAAQNPAFARMVGCVLFFVSGVAIQGTLHRLVLADVMNAEPQFPIMILLENVGTLLCVPLWLAISRRIGKAPALTAAALWLATWSLPLIFMRAGDQNLMIALVVIRGSSFASILFLANSIAADVIDVDALASGEQRSGLFFAVWGMMTKLSLAVGLLLGTSLPTLVDYSPSLEIVPAPVQANLMWIYGGVPALLMGIGALFLRNFPIDRQRHAEIRAELDALSSEAPNQDSPSRESV